MLHIEENKTPPGCEADFTPLDALIFVLYAFMDKRSCIGLVKTSSGGHKFASTKQVEVSQLGNSCLK